jgi:hypothetical protein
VFTNKDITLPSFLEGIGILKNAVSLIADVRVGYYEAGFYFILVFKIIFISSDFFFFSFILYSNFVILF